MSSKLIFLSHIHEESEMAVLIQQAIEAEFAGFVEVFVSSDGKTIPAGANFLKKIESGLADCVAGLFVVSPKSAPRSWINFELGSLWIRSVLSVRNGGNEVPCIPLCHSGMERSSLPTPLSHLNAIKANDSAQLERAFRSIQSAVGGRGPLRTDFDSLALMVSKLEGEYTLGDKWREFVRLCIADAQRAEFVAELKLVGARLCRVPVSSVLQANYERMKELVESGLNSVVEMQAISSRTILSNHGTYSVVDLEVVINGTRIHGHLDGLD